MVAGPGRNLASRCVAADNAGTNRRTTRADEDWRSWRGSRRSARRPPARRLWRCRFDRDALHRRAEPNLAAGRGNGARQGGDDDVGAAAAQRHAEGLIRHGFQIGKQRAAGAKSGEKSRCMPQIAIMVLSLSFSKFSSSHSRGEATRSRAVSATHAVPRVRHAPKATRRACHDGNGEAEQSKDMRRVRAERRRHGAPAFGIRRAQRGDAVGVGFGIFFHAEPGAIWEGGGEASFGADEVEAVCNAGDPCGRQKTASRRTGPNSSRRDRDESRAG